MRTSLLLSVLGLGLGLAMGLTACATDTESSEPTTTRATTTGTSTTTDKGAPKTTDKTTAQTSTSKPAPAKAEIGKTAPDFTLTDIDGRSVSLDDFRGKTVVLEWFNPQCPFVVYAYEEGPLRDMAARWAKDDVVWLTINSGAPGKQGAGLELNKKAFGDWRMSSRLVLDESGTVGRAYDAKTTPHMYVIDPKGVLVYRGALDNAARGQVAGDGPVNYVEDALLAVQANRPVEQSDTKPYGCSVKYAQP